MVMFFEVGDQVEIVTASMDFLVGQTAEVLKVKNGEFGIQLRLRTDSGFEVWTPGENVILH